MAVKIKLSKCIKIHQKNFFFLGNRYKLRSVQERLRKTEKAMKEILSQLELIAENKEKTNEEKDECSNFKEDKITEETQNMEKSLEELKVFNFVNFLTFSCLSFITSTFFVTVLFIF